MLIIFLKYLDTNKLSYKLTTLIPTWVVRWDGLGILALRNKNVNTKLQQIIGAEGI